MISLFRQLSLFKVFHNLIYTADVYVDFSSCLKTTSHIVTLVYVHGSNIEPKDSLSADRSNNNARELSLQ